MCGRAVCVLIFVPSSDWLFCATRGAFLRRLFTFFYGKSSERCGASTATPFQKMKFIKTYIYYFVPFFVLFLFGLKQSKREVTSYLALKRGNKKYIFSISGQRQYYESGKNKTGVLSVTAAFERTGEILHTRTLFLIKISLMDLYRHLQDKSGIAKKNLSSQFFILKSFLVSLLDVVPAAGAWRWRHIRDTTSCRIFFLYFTIFLRDSPQMPTQTH